MIKLSEKYTLKNDHHSWRLISRVESDHYKAKDGFVDENRWYPTIQMVLLHIFDELLKECNGDIVDLLKAVEDAREEIRGMEFKIKEGER